MTIFDLSTNVTLNVTTFEDQNDGSDFNGLSLRDAILQANANPSKEYTINLPAWTYNLTLQNTLQPPTIDDSTIDLDTLKESRKTTGDLDITGRITIIGDDPANTIISATGLQNQFRARSGGEVTDGTTSSSTVGNLFTVGDRLFDVATGGILTLQNLTIQDGLLIDSQLITVNVEGQNSSTIISIGNIDTVPNGGAINIDFGGTAIINNSIIKSSRTEQKGGGINNSGSLELNDSIVENNQATNINRAEVPQLKTAGGIFNTGTMKINRSAIINNFVETATPTDIEGAGGGVVNEAGATIIIVNSTISGNDAGIDAGGGILNRGRATVINSTVTDNIGQVGSGIYSETTNADTVLNNTIVANNKVQTQITREVRRAFPQFTLNGNSNNPGFINEFVWDTIDQNPNDALTDFYIPRVLLKNSDPFFPFPEGIDVTSRVNLDNLILNRTTGNIEFVFNVFTGIDQDGFFSQSNGFQNEDDNLVRNTDNNFVFAYRQNSNNLVYLEPEFELDQDGKLVLVLLDPTINPNTTFTERIFLTDQEEVFDFTSFNNKLRTTNDNKAQADFVRVPENDQVYSFNDVVAFENRTISTIITEITNPPLNTDIDGIFNGSSSFNLIGSSSANGILNGVRNNIVGSVSATVDPKLGPLQNNGGSTPTHALLTGSPAINNGNNVVTNIRTFFDTPVTDQRGIARISNGTVDIGSFESNLGSSTNTSNNSTTTGTNTNSNNTNSNTNNTSNNNSIDSLLNTPIFRLQNQDLLGTYLYAGAEETSNIQRNFTNFQNEGFAFNVSNTPQDNLIPIYRFQNKDIAGTYLYVGEGERQSILQNHPNFLENGLAFYVYGADANKGQDIYRLQNIQLPGTYLFVGAAERQNILTNYTNFIDEGVAFEVG